MYLLRRKRKGKGVVSVSPCEVSESKHDASSSSSGFTPKGPRLDRHKAIRHIDYDLVSATERVSWSMSSSSSCEDAPTTWSLDLPFYEGQTSFRISGYGDGHEIEEICRNLGLSGPDEFSISITEWEARKSRLSSEVSPASGIKSDFVSSSGDDLSPSGMICQPVEDQNDKVDIKGEGRLDAGIVFANKSENDKLATPMIGGENGGIRGVRPPVLLPPQPVIFDSLTVLNSNGKASSLVLKTLPGMCLPGLDKTTSAWEIIRLFATIDEAEICESVDSEVDGEIPTVEVIGDVSEVIEELTELRLGETVEGFTGVSSYSTVNDDDSSSTTTEATVIVSPNGLFKTKIKSWSRGALLGSGSYGTVYEAISEEGVFFAVKEVSLLDEGSNAQQCIDQLEQEIALLSQLEHENIVKYYGTAKEDKKLLIFLELVTKGSLASLYQTYHLQDSHISAYTRQILNGLKYLHDRNVVHRDIKCANILVDANGSVKLADFGLAKEMTELNALKSCKGSVYWMAPEVVNHKKTYGLSADIWSLGCTVLEMLTCQIPYPDVEWMQALYKIGQGEQPPIPSHLSRDAREFISQCVRVNPDDRPTAVQLLEHPFVNRQTPLG